MSEFDSAPKEVAPTDANRDKPVRRRRKMSNQQRIIRLLEKQYSVKYIVEHVKGITPQHVYVARYTMNKKKGLGALTPTTQPAPTQPAPTQDKPVRKVRAGTGIKANPAPRAVPTARPVPGEWKEVSATALPITMQAPPTLWQRIVRFFKGE